VALEQGFPRSSVLFCPHQTAHYHTHGHGFGASPITAPRGVRQPSPNSPLSYPRSWVWAFTHHSPTWCATALRDNLVCSSLWDFKSSFTCRKILRHETFPFYFPSERKMCWGFLSPLEFHSLGRVRTHNLWVHWQAY
jgi:hypothetical protein